MPSSNLHFSTKRRRVKVSPDEVKHRRETLIGKDSWIVNYDLDTEGELWCEVRVILHYVYIY